MTKRFGVVEENGVQRFTVTEAHLLLLRRAYVRWEDCEFGAPAIDCKRPYGNSSVYSDIGEILGEGPSGDSDYGEPDWSDEQRNRFDRLHSETLTALQIALATGRFETGTFTARLYSSKWSPSHE